MPTYDYECENCGLRFERFQSISENPLRKCPECSGKVRRLIGSGGGVIFKGGASHSMNRGHGDEGHDQCCRDQPCCGRDEPCERPPCKD